VLALAVFFFALLFVALRESRECQQYGGGQ
jgi:hypothetical protein